MRNSWTKTGKGESTRANGQESSLLRYDNTQSILEEEGEYNLTERSNSNIPQLHISSSIQHNPSTEGVKELSSEQLASLKESFERFSSTKTLKKPARSRLNANGIREIMTSEPEVDITLSEKQLNQLFADASVPLHKATLTQIYANLSRAKPGKGVSFNDLLELMQQPNASQQTQTDYEQLFKMYDRKNRGFFDFQDYKYLCEGVAKQLTEAQLRAAFDAMDSEHEGRIVLGDSLIGYILYCTLMSDLQRLLFHDKFQKREKWFRLFENEVWTPRYNIDLPAQRSLAYQQLSQVAKSGIVSVRNFFDDPTNIFTAHEMLGTISASTSTKFTVHYNLFGGSIVALHTDRHKWIFDQIDSLAVTGCFCLTELGYGNNAVQMETTSTYDEKTKEFVIDCPTVVSQKYWITNGAVHANYALVFAQTYVKGKHEGVNAFLVPIRDKGLKALPGVEINDMGIKIGLNGIDNAALKFHNVRVPRVNMMNKYADVDENGVFRSDVKGIQQRFFKVTERLLSGRLCIASMMLGGLKSAIYLSVKYYQQRKGVSPNGLSQTPIFDYQLQKNAVIPLVAKALALNMLHNYAKSVFANPKGHEDDLLITCCVDKAMMGWHGERTVSILRERSGGQGFLAANFFAEFIASAHAGITAEGDNKVLMIKVVKDLLSIYMKRQDYFYTGDFIKITEEKQLFCLQTLNKLFLMLEKFKLDRLITKMTNLKSSGKTNYEILMFQTSDETQELAYSHGEKLTFASCISSLQRLTDSKATVKNYFILFAWQVLQRQMSLLLLEGWICPNLAKNFKEIYNQQIKVAAKDIDVVIESLNIPVHALKVPIAKDYVKYNSYANLGEVVNAKL